MIKKICLCVVFPWAGVTVKVFSVILRTNKVIKKLFQISLLLVVFKLILWRDMKLGPVGVRKVYYNLTEICLILGLY